MVLRHVPLVKGRPQAVVEPPLTIDTWRQGGIIMPEWAAVDWFPHRRVRRVHQSASALSRQVNGAQGAPFYEASLVNPLG